MSQIKFSLYDFSMLLRFKCRNFYSIRDEQELSLVAAKTRVSEHEESLLETGIAGVKALRSAAIFGANASGKSNLLLAMRSFSSIVTNSWRQWEPIGPIPAWKPFLLNRSSREGDALLEVDFILESIVYNYGFRFNEHRFLEEWLIDKTGRDKTLFRRTSNEEATSILFPGRNLPDAKQLENIQKQTRANSLFLSSAAQSGYEPLTRIYEWIVERFTTLTADSMRENPYTAKQCKEAKRKGQVRDILISSGTGVIDLQIAEEKVSDSMLNFYNALREARKSTGEEALDDLPAPPVSRTRVVMFHSGEGGEMYPLPFEVQSGGTIAFFGMLGPILNELETGSILLIDELESSLHPNLARYILKMFNDPLLNPKGAQLIFTTHNPSLLDLDLLRRDQIWIAEKDGVGASEFKALSDFKPRKGQDVATAYLNGRFGGVPFVDEGLLRSALKINQDERTETVSTGEGV